MGAKPVFRGLQAVPDTRLAQVLLGTWSTCGSGHIVCGPGLGGFLFTLEVVALGLGLDAANKDGAASLTR